MALNTVGPTIDAVPARYVAEEFHGTKDVLPEAILSGEDSTSPSATAGERPWSAAYAANTSRDGRPRAQEALVEDGGHVVNGQKSRTDERRRRTSGLARAPPGPRRTADEAELFGQGDLLVAVVEVVGLGVLQEVHGHGRERRGETVQDRGTPGGARAPAVTRLPRRWDRRRASALRRARAG
ncbi:hypothetical protein STANM309S_00707 [Streptomyces tanashiensis]